VTKQSFSDLALAAYCPRKLYYRRREGKREVPSKVEELRDLAFRYEEALSPGGGDVLAEAPIAVTATEFRTNLGCSKARLDAWDALADPPRREAFLEGRDVRGIAHKVLKEPLAPVIVSPGEPPDNGVWKPQSVRAVAAAKALAWEEETPIERAFVEYPAHGHVREIGIGTRRKAAYRAALRAARGLDDPPPRLDDDTKCEPCEFREQCGVRTRTLRSLLSTSG
jgi:CRISPR-associated exonuclease Cas4